ncbi:MAG TPA: MFS transporter [Caulobacteraceae bacterium]|jgi:MFS family permease|nr:MFS transporter [Caulobacteraceae bacterium]
MAKLTSIMSLAPALPSTNVLRHRDFSLFWVCRFLMNLGVQVESVAIGWQVYEVARRTRGVDQSAFLVGMVGLAQFVPLFVLTLVAGAMADRLDRGRLVMASLAVELVCVVALAMLALHPQPSFTPIFVIAATFGAARAFMNPAAGAMAPMLVPRDELPRAIAWSSMAWQSASIMGPFIGGVLVALATPAAYAGAGAMYAGAILCLVLMRTNTRPTSTPQSRIAAIREGIAYVWRTKEILGAVSLDLFAVLLGGATALLPVFAKDVLHVGASGFGLLRAAPAIGAVMIGFGLSRWPLRRRAGLWMFGGVAVFGIGTLIFALSRDVWLSVFGLVVLGAGDMLSVNVRLTLVQIVTPDHMRGRVSAVSTLFVGASNELGEFESGVAARLLGPIGAALFGGIGALAVTLMWAGMFPSLRKADKLLEM